MGYLKQVSFNTQHNWLLLTAVSMGQPVVPWSWEMNSGRPEAGVLAAMWFGITWWVPLLVKKKEPETSEAGT